MDALLKPSISNPLEVVRHSFVIYLSIGIDYSLFLTLIERLSITLRQTANGKNETFAVCLQLSVQWGENIFICGE